jgi:hypothetical protein
MGFTSTGRGIREAGEFFGIAGDPVGAKESGFCGPFVIFSKEDAAFASGESFYGVEGKCGNIGPGVASEFPIAPLGMETATCAMAGILDHIHPSAARNSRDLRHIAWDAGIVHGNDRTRVVLPIRLKSRGIDVAGLGVDIAKIRRSSNIRSRIGRSYECDRRGDNAVTGADPENAHSQMQGGRGVANSNRVLCSDTGGEFALE